MPAAPPQSVEEEVSSCTLIQAMSPELGNGFEYRIQTVIEKHIIQETAAIIYILLLIPYWIVVSVGIQYHHLFSARSGLLGFSNGNS